MKTKCGLDAEIKHTDDTHHHGIIKTDSRESFAKWDKVTGKCVYPPYGNGVLDLVLEQSEKTVKYAEIENELRLYYKNTHEPIGCICGVDIPATNPKFFGAEGMPTHYMGMRIIYEEQKPKYELPNQTNRHYKFAKYCQSIGYPDIEITGVANDWVRVIEPKFHENWNYRIENDPHHELRREWIDSDGTLQVESSLDGVAWRKSKAKWKSSVKYRKAEKPLWHDYIEQGYSVGLVINGSFAGIWDRLPASDNIACTTPDGKYLAAFKDGYLHIMPVERGDTQLGINPEMDKLARDNGLAHWSCVSKSSRRWWVRGTDKQEFFMSQSPEDNEVVEFLKILDKEHPIKG